MSVNADCEFEDRRPVPSVDFNYDAIDNYAFSDSSAEAAWQTAAEALRTLVDWLDDTASDRSKVIRLQAVKGLLYGRNQTDLAKEIGVTKAAISQMSTKFRDTFNFNHAKNIRTEQTRKEFSQQCTQRHAQKKQQQNQVSTNSPPP